MIEGLKKTGEELENEEDNAQALILTWERRMNRYTEMFRRRSLDMATIQIMPVDPEENKPREHLKDHQEQPIIVDLPIVTLEKHIYVNVAFDYNKIEENCIEKLAPPKDFSALTDLDQTFQLKPPTPFTY